MSRFYPYFLLASLFIFSQFILYSNYSDRVTRHDEEEIRSISRGYEVSLDDAFKKNRILFFENFYEYEISKTLKFASNDLDRGSSLEFDSHKNLLSALVSSSFYTSEDFIMALRFYSKDGQNILSLNKYNNNIKYILPQKEIVKIENESFFLGRDGNYHYVEPIYFEGSLIGYFELVNSAEHVISQRIQNYYIIFDNNFIDSRCDRFHKCKIFENHSCLDGAKEAFSQIISKYENSNYLKNRNYMCEDSKKLKKSICFLSIAQDGEHIGYIGAIDTNIAKLEMLEDYLFKAITTMTFFLVLIYLYIKTQRANLQSQRLSRILSKSKELLFMLDAQNFKIEFANKEALKVLNVEKSSISGREFFEFCNSITDLKKREILSALDKNEIITIYEKIGGELNDGEYRLNFQKVEDDGEVFIFVIAQDVSYELKLEKKIERQKEFLEILIDTIPTPIYVKNSKCEYVLVNREFCRFFGLENKDRVIGKSDFELDMPDFMAMRFFDQDREVLSSKKILKIESEELASTSGKRVWYKTLKVPLIGLNYPIKDDMLLGISTDVTQNEELKLNLQKLNSELEIIVKDEVDKRFKSEEKYRGLFDNISSPIVVLQRKGKLNTLEITAVNKDACTLFNLKKEDLKGRDIDEVLGVKENSESPLYFYNDRKNSVKFHTQIIDGSEKLLKINIHSYQNSDGERVILSISDVTEKIKLKQEKKEQKKLFEALFRSANSGICILDENGGFYKFNSAFSNIVGIESNELKKEKFVNILTCEYKSIFLEEQKSIFFENLDVQNEYKLNTKERGELFVFGSSVPLMLDSGIKYRIMILENISKLKNLEEQQKEQERMMFQQAKMAEMGDMIGAIAHQWRQPLNSINAAAIKLKFAYELDGISQEMLDETTEFIESQSNKMSETINDFLNFFKPSKERERFYLCEVLGKIEQMLKSQLESRGIVLKAGIPKDILIEGFKNELEHVLLNLIINARDAFENQSIEDKYIEILGSESGSECEITIQDNAGGIPQSIMDKIFNPYFTTKSPNKGTGIGLYMSKAIIEKSFDGKLSVANTQFGAQFKITIQKEFNL